MRNESSKHHDGTAVSITVEASANMSQTSNSPASVTTSTRSRRVGIWSAVVASLASAAIVLASAHYYRPPAPPAKRDPRVLLSDKAVGFVNGAAQWDQVKVGTAEAAKRRWSDPYPAHVRVDETRTSRVGAPLAGRVLRVLVEIGQRVSVGTPLFTVASPDMATLQTEQLKAEVELSTAKVALDRVHSIVQAQALPAKDELLAAQQLKEAELAHRVAEARLASLKVQPTSDNAYVVKSPRNGVVVEKSILPDQEIAIDPTLVPIVVADVSSVWVVAELFETDVTGIVPGTPARVNVNTEVIDAKVDTVAASVDPERHTVAVRVTLPNPTGSLRPNTFAKVEFESQISATAVEIAASALISDGTKQYVYVRRADGLFERRDVVVGPVREGRATVVRGLQVGESLAEVGAVLIDNQLAISR